MIEHVSLQVSDYKKAKEFYTKALSPLEYKLTSDMPEYKAAGFKEAGHTSFWISEEETVTPTHIAFNGKSKKEVDDFYAEAIKAGGKDNGKPGYRKHYSPGTYAAFVHDTDGNNIEAVWFDPKLEGQDYNHK